MAKEKFQDLQRAYDTLKDQLERSKYDEDNSYHGLPEGSRPKAKSSTAKRYAGGGGGASGGAPPGPTPGWTTGSATFTRGFAQQAHTAGSRHTGGHRSSYEDFQSTGSPYSGTRKQRTNYDYANFARPAQPPPPPPPPPRPTAADDDSFEYNYYGYRPERPESSGPRESAYARTSQRQANTTPTGSTMPRASSSTRRAHSTVGGGVRDPSTQGPDFNIGAYIKERRAKEEEQARRDEEAARQREEEKRKRDDAARAARKEEHRAREYERRRAEELRREAEAEEEARRAEEEARRSQDEARRRNPWAQTDTGQYSGGGFARPDVPQFPGGVTEDDLQRVVDERLAEGQRKSKSTFGTASRSHSRRSPSKSKVRRDADWSTSNGYSDGWGKSGNHSDNSGSQNHFTSAEEDAGLSYVEKLQRRGRGKTATAEQVEDPDAGLSFVEKLQKRDREAKAAEERAEQQQEQKEQQRKWEEMLRNKGHGRAKSETQPRDRPRTPDRPRTSGQDTPNSGPSKRGSPSVESTANKRRNSSARQNSADFKYLPLLYIYCVDEVNM